MAPRVRISAVIIQAELVIVDDELDTIEPMNPSQPVKVGIHKAAEYIADLPDVVARAVAEQTGGEEEPEPEPTPINRAAKRATARRK